MSRSYLLRKPRDEDEDDYGMELIKAKPIDARFARNLGSSYSGGKDFVKASQKSQQEFYGSQEILGENAKNAKQTAATFRELTHDERNKLSASIIKAELKGDMDKVQKLKQKLEEGVVAVKEDEMSTTTPCCSSASASSKEKETVVLMHMDRRSGQAMPTKSQNEVISGVYGAKRKGTVDTEFEKEMSLNQMIADEKQITAEQQIAMFGRAAKVCAESRTDDDWNLDDNMLSHPKKRRHEEKDAKLKQRQRIQEHKFAERTLDSCPKCIESGQLEKYAIVATGLKTYLAVVSHSGLSPDHCYIAPMGHYASSVLLDEDVWEEMRLWMKGLVAMWRDDDDQDCVFIESTIHVREQKHMSIECIPMPREVGDMAPIYFKKAIMESEKEWSDNPKLVDLSKNPRQSAAGVRGAVPKGFPYFFINFGLQPGYAHVIEDEGKFPANFAQEIIGGMLDLPYQHWKNPKRQSFEEVKQKRAQFRTKWAKYDWTEIVKREINASINEDDDDRKG